MSSIMNELRKLEGKRTRSPAPVHGTPPPPANATNQPSDSPDGPERGRPRRIIVVVAAILGLATAAVVLPQLGGSRRTAREPDTPAPPITLAKAGDRVTETLPGPDPIETVQEPTFELAAVVQHEPETEDNAAEPRADEPAVLLDPIEPLREPTFELAAVDTGPSETASEPVPPPTEGADLTEDPTGDTEADADDAEPPPEPARVLTEAEDEANKAAIRKLVLNAVFSDDDGIVVFTSEGELRAGARYRGMDVTRVTTRYVIFEDGNKRYRWRLPRRGLATAGSGNT